MVYNARSGALGDAGSPRIVALTTDGVRAAGHRVKAMVKMTSIGQAKYTVGQVVRHRVYSFRGVIFDIDPIFSNTEEWWLSIPAEVRPKKEQPFYHLLAENSETEYVAYVSEQNPASRHLRRAAAPSADRGDVCAGRGRQLSTAVPPASALRPASKRKRPPRAGRPELWAARPAAYFLAGGAGGAAGGAEGGATLPCIFCRSSFCFFISA